MSDTRPTFYRLLLSVFVATVLTGTACVVVQCVWGEVPVGVCGQPRSGTLPADWSVPPWLLMLYLSTLLCLLLVPLRPLVGVLSYTMISWVLPVHTPAWIFTQWIGIRTIVAVLALAGCTLYAYRWRELRWPWQGWISALFLSFAAWYAVSAAAALWRSGHYSPPLQFHPIQLMDALAVFSVVLVLRNRDPMLFMLAVGLAAMAASAVDRLGACRTVVRVHRIMGLPGNGHVSVPYDAGSDVYLDGRWGNRRVHG